MEQQRSQEQVKEYRASVQDGEQRPFDRSSQAAELMSDDQCQTIREVDDSQLVGAPAPITAGDELVAREDVSMADVEVRNEAKAAAMSTVKRRRGRPPRIQGKNAPPPPAPPQRAKKDEEDVCFICFDGGSLVLCDRRGCPKAYHAACIKRDESFFRSKAKWNCGWHICSSCQKASHYMCYTCTYSLCKGCTKDSDYLSVRGNKGFCGTCMRTILLIENIPVGNKEMVQVDFDDKTSWEYLFKVYWIYLKAKLSLNLDELSKAKNPWKGDELPKAKNSLKGAVTVAPERESLGEHHGKIEKSSCLDNCCGDLEANYSKRRKILNQPKVLENGSFGVERSGVREVTNLHGGTEWATNELLEFVAYMKNGDVSVLSQFDVQALLLEYIKRNNLFDPRRKCQIICDSRLLKLFGKEHVGQFEMLKLLEYHFVTKEKSTVNDIVIAGVADAVGSQAVGAGNNDFQQTMGSDRRRKMRKKTQETGLNNPNLDEYAAIDVHNINLLYLKRGFLEDLMDDSELFHGKVVGSFVRIRMSGGDQKQDMHRLVQVVGTSKVAVSYKVGTKTTDIMLEVLNFDKKELVSINEISDEQFSEDECRHLCQSIKCGLIKLPRVGEIQEKALVLGAVKVNDWQEAEISSIDNLCDRASETGHRKELRECVEKLEGLKSPNEQQRRLIDISNIHTDPNMDPRCESDGHAGELDEKKQGDHVRPTNPDAGRKRDQLNSSLRGVGDLNIGKGAQMDLATGCEQSRSVCTAFYVDRDGTTRIGQGGEAFGQNSQNTPKNQVAPVGSVTGNWSGQTMVQSQPVSVVAAINLSPPCSTGRELSFDDIETEKVWNYQDPTGKIQGPFSMLQLCKWSMNGHFPPDLRIWRTNDKQCGTILLTDALALPQSSYLLPQDVKNAHNDTNIKWEGRLGQNTNVAWLESKKVEKCKSIENDATVHCNVSTEIVGSNKWGFHSSICSKTVDPPIVSDQQTQSSLQGQGLSTGANPCPDQGHVCSSHSSTSSSGKLCEIQLLQIREGHGSENLISGPSNVNVNSHKIFGGQTIIRESDEKRADSEGHSSHSSGQNWRPPSTNNSSGWDSSSSFVSVANSTETSKQNQEINFFDLLSLTPKQRHEDLKGRPPESKQLVSLNFPVLDSGPSWSTASSLVIGGAQLPEVVSEWGGNSLTLARPAAEEWDSKLVPASSLKPSEAASDHAATPTSGSGQVMDSSPTHPAIPASGWQSIDPETNEFYTLVDESVSDLLAEVEAMESLGGLPSPTSKLRSGGELQGSI